MFVCYFLDPVLWLKTRRQQNKGALILKWVLRHLLHTTMRNGGKFQAEPVFFLLFFGDKKEYLLNVLLTRTFMP